MPSRARRCALSALAALVLTAPAALAQSRTAAPLEIRVPFAPQVVSVGGAPRLFYEFHLASHAPVDGTLDEVEISNADTGAVLSDEKGPALDGQITRPGRKAAAAEPRRMAPGSIGVVFMETTLPAGAPPPTRLRWRLAFSPDPSAPPQPVPWTPAEGDISVDTAAPIAIGYPLPTGRWVAVNGPSNTSAHRRTLLVVDGRARIAQRYAIDWMELGPDGRFFHGDRANNASWYSYGVPVLAVADATVSTAQDGLPENVPDKLAVPITLETIAGNHIILDLGGGRYAFYAHLQPGSLKVKVGDKVRRGQVIGLLGNTGNSGAPHLHLDIADANSPLGAEGVPSVFESFASRGLADLAQTETPGGWRPTDPPLQRKNAMPLENEVVDIP